MARLILPRRWTIQPTQPVRIDAGNPITRGLIDAVLPFGGLWRSVPQALGQPLDLTTAQDQTLFTNTNSPVATWGIRGFGFTYSQGGSTYSSRASAPLSQVKECSALVVCAPNAGASNGTFFGYSRSSSANPFLSIENEGPGNAGWAVKDDAGTIQRLTGSGSVGFSGLNPHVVIGSRSQLQNFMRVYTNGMLVGTTTATTLSTTTLNQASIGCSLRNSATNFTTGMVFLCLAWDRALDADECHELSLNPWQVFEFPNSRALTDVSVSTFLAAQQKPILQAVKRAGTY